MAFRETKGKLGFEASCNRTERAVERTAPLALVSYSLIVLWNVLHGQRLRAARLRSGQMLEFSDAWVRFDPDRREFEAQVVNGSWPDGAGWRFRGRYHRGGGVIATALTGTRTASRAGALSRKRRWGHRLRWLG